MYQPSKRKIVVTKYKSVGTDIQPFDHEEEDKPL